MMTGDSSRPANTDPLDLTNLSRSEFVNAMIHLYRGELGEATAWRSRIDTTTQWAVVLSTTVLTFVFSESSGDRHVVIPIVMFFVTFMLLIESRRYRFYDIWRSRARMIEINFYRPLLDGSPAPLPTWREVLAKDLEWPCPHISFREAVGRRLRRNYQWIYIILLGSWLVGLIAFPEPTAAFNIVVSRASIGPFSGLLVFALMLIFYALLLVLGIVSYWDSRIRKSLPAGHPGRMSLVQH